MSAVYTISTNVSVSELNSGKEGALRAKLVRIRKSIESVKMSILTLERGDSPERSRKLAKLREELRSQRVRFKSASTRLGSIKGQNRRKALGKAVHNDRKRDFSIYSSRKEFYNNFHDQKLRRTANDEYGARRAMQFSAVGVTYGTSMVDVVVY